MKELFAEFRSALSATVILALVCCGLYPLVVFGISQTLFPHKANGSLILDSKGVVRGSSLIGQGFTGAKYFHSRPSAAGNGYDATSSGGSNLGPSSKKLRDSIAQNVIDYRDQNGMATNAPVPADAVTASASGLDPHISPESARLQIERIAKARGFNDRRKQSLVALVEQFIEPPQLGILGNPRVNILLLNRAVDELP
jgi:K+-transporting ATPase ATPase C chain